jgi:spermidine synthase
MFNKQFQSGIEKEKADEDNLVATTCGYVNMLHLGMLFCNTNPHNLLVIGCGGGVGPKIFEQDYPFLKNIDVVDVDREVFRMARKYFLFPEEGAESKIKAHLVDGRRFVRNADKKYDYIILDAYSAGGKIPFHLLTKEFFEETNLKMTSGGVLVINIISAIDGKNSRLLKSAVNTLDTVFSTGKTGNIYVFPRLKKRYSERAQNVIVVCTKNGKRIDKKEMFANLLRLRKEGLIFNEKVDGYARALEQWKGTFSGEPVLTDDFAPTDSMVCR